MADESYTAFEAKARFSEVLKKVREGRIITVTYRGEPVAEIRPLDRSSGLAARLEWLRSRGVIVPASRKLSDAPLPLGPAKPGALERFLKDRDG